MKTIASFLFLLIFSYLPSQGQTSLFDITDTKWVVSHLTVVGPGGDARERFFELFTTTDTVINELTYTTLAIRNLCSLRYYPHSETFSVSLSDNK